VKVTVLVCGGRDFADAELLNEELDALHQGGLIGRLVHGAAPGADTLAGEWALRNNVPIRAYPADWKTHGPKAGPIRNQYMLDAQLPYMVLAFPGGRGTADMVRRAKRAGILTVSVKRTRAASIPMHSDT
jgi:hypothetical protein